MDWMITVIHRLHRGLVIAAFLLAPIAWVVFAVSQLRLKNTYTEGQRKRRRCLRTVSLILAILFTALLLFISVCLMEPSPTPLPQEETAHTMIVRFL